MVRMMSFAIRRARSWHSALVQTTPPCAGTYFNVQWRHSGQRNQLASHIRKLWGGLSSSDLIGFRESLAGGT